ncbi:MAG: PhzF family phenazine biosynthesis protein [Saprospiraceae bacterium]
MKKTQIIYQVDAFTEKIFGGNPAAVCPLDNWLSDELMQNIAMENNLAETAFYVPKANHFELRWFTPTVEVDLCGHATLASAHVIFSNGFEGNEVIFISPRSGELRVRKNDGMYTMNFPTDVLEKIETPDEIIKGLGIIPIEVFKGKTDYMVIVQNQTIIESLQPNLKLLEKLDARGTIVTAPGQEVDFVSRCFFPQAGVDEDPTTGSAHTSMTPYWANKLGKTEMTAIQLSKRKGHLNCKYLNERVEISGQAKTYLTGHIFI